MFDAATKDLIAEVLAERMELKRLEGEEKFDYINWGSIEGHFAYLEQLSRDNAQLNKHQVGLLFETVQKICDRNPVCRLYSSFRGMQAIQLVTFINTCQ